MGQLEGIDSNAAETIWATRDLSAESDMGHLHVIGSISFNSDRPIQYHRRCLFIFQLANSNILAAPSLSSCGPSRIHLRCVDGPTP